VQDPGAALQGRRVVVVGLARTGVAACRFLLARGARVVATDRRTAAELPDEVMSLAERGVSLELGAHRESTLRAADAVVVSPGVPWEEPALRAARGAGVPVMAELELAFRHLRGRVAAVTGTKGKSTTTAALGAMLRAPGADVRVGGNIGAPLVGLLEGATESTTFVVEVSSFQLEGTQAFRPDVAVFLNLSPDHLDRHPSFEAYAAAKARVFANQGTEDWAVVNGGDPAVRELARAGRARLVTFAPLPHPPVEGASGQAFFAEGTARLRLGEAEEALFARSEARVPGEHLALDLLAAAAAARLLGGSPEAIARAVRGFAGVEHVLERVEELDGVAFYNDSKATNVEAARRSLEAFAGPILLIAGGRYKGGDFTDLAPALERHGKAVFAIGESRLRLAEALARVVPVILCATLAEAVDLAFAEAEAGDTVLLAPACSSFDMFQDYAERGRVFKEEVRRLAARQAQGVP
jgi:UDP-N-acetylmuramoylalanine--D-glutamate ligase